jgi:hypothetical protein
VDPPAGGLAMVTPKQRLEDTLGFLSGQLHWGWISLKSAKVLHDTDWGASAIWFRRAAYQACLKDTLLTLARLVIEHKDSITFFYLFAQAQHSPQLFEFAEPDQVRAVATQHKRTIQDHELVPTIKVLRDKVLAHFDRKHINDPSAITSAPVDMIEVERCYEELLHILNVYKRYYEDSELYLGLTEEAVRDDVDHLAELIRKANESHSSI